MSGSRIAAASSPFASAGVDGIAAFARESGFEVLGEAESRVPGPKGNREVFLHLRWAGGEKGPLDFGGGGR